MNMVEVGFVECEGLKNSGFDFGSRLVSARFSSSTTGLCFSRRFRG